MVVPISRALIGNRSAVVIKTPKGDVKSRIIPAGTIHIEGQMKNRIVSLDNGAEAIMSVLEQCYPVIDIWGEIMQVECSKESESLWLNLLTKILKI